MPTIQDLDGRHEIRMMNRYAHPSQQHNQSAVEKIVANSNWLSLLHKVTSP
jgi:hypothetical protein